MDIFDYGTYSIGRIRIEGSDSNYNYIIWCNTTLHGAFVDPLDGSLLLDFTRAKKIKIRYVINSFASGCARTTASVFLNTSSFPPI